MNAGRKTWPEVTTTAETRDIKSSEFIEAQISFAAPRRIMQTLRDLMNANQPPDTKLDEIVRLVARELRADECSCYIQRAGEVLELYSSSVLEPAACTEMGRVGEGDIGDVAAAAAPIVIANKPEAPVYHSFCGVPVLRGGRVRGVLAVRSKSPRNYGEETVDILQTIAMVVAEIVIAGGLLTRLEINSSFSSGGKPTHVSGASLARGLAIGTAVLYEPGIAMQEIVAEDAKAEKARLAEALASMHNAIDRMLNRNAVLSGTESRDILEAYQMFAKDRGWLARIDATIEKGLSAEAAVQRVQNETRARMMQISDAYIRERLQDLEDLSNRLLSHLMKDTRVKSHQDMPDNIILVARTLGPAALLDFDHTKLRGVILEKGSASNHVAIVARALGIPVVGQCGDIHNFVFNGDQVIVDGDHGMVYIGPGDYIVDLYTKTMDARDKRASLYRQKGQQQSVTQDGIKVAVHLNAGLMNEVDSVAALGADGIGLYRTELSFMGWQKYPLVVTQAEFYGNIMDKMAGKPVVFRTLDIGGDKPLPYFKAPEEENPALGWRAVRIGMDRPAVLRTQFRAFIRGSRGRPLKIMLPFITEVAEFERAKEFLEMEKVRARGNGITVPEKIELGAMIEVPAILWQLDTLLKVADFVAVGTNDLMQYLFAADRNNFALRNRYDVLSPAMLRVMKDIADKCTAANVPFSVCGEMAGSPLEAMVLIALGYRQLSVSAQSVEAVKGMLPTLDTTTLKPYLDQLMQSREHSLRERLLSFARDHHVNLSPTE
ncbi:MAG: phosphoenolpyruvate--protein phosphotransferase [bacterium]|nr:phosphoenolpyruvate--protein phosphotransferase [bacterium]